MRTLTAAISGQAGLDSMAAVYVLEVKKGADVLVRATNWRPISEWDGAGSDGYGLGEYGLTPYGVGSSPGDASDTLIRLPVIRQEIDWRGGLAHFSEQAFEVVDESGSIRQALSGAMDMDVEVWFLLVDGDIDKATQAIQIYAGCVAGFQVKGDVVSIFSGDRREKRYPPNLLSKIEVSNEDNFCGAGRLIEEAGGILVWDTTSWEYRDEWIPDSSRGKLIPITFNRPNRCKLVLVSGWPGGEGLSAGQYLRGPLLLLSDMRVDYGTSLIPPVGTVFRVDMQTGELWNTTVHNNIQRNQVPGITGRRPIVSIGADEVLNNAWRAAKSVNTFARIWAENRDLVHANIEGDWSTFWDRLEDEFQCLRLTAVDYVGSTRSILRLAFRDAVFPNGAGKVRHAYIEVYVKNFGNPLPSGVEMRISLSRNPDWSGHADEYLDEITLLTSAASEFNNWDWGSGAQSWADGNVSFGGASPFSVTGTLGPQSLDSFRNEELRLRMTGLTEAIDPLDVRIFGFGLIVAVDFPLEDIVDQLGAHCSYSFDNYAMGRTGSSDFCRSHETIYATLHKLFGVPTDEILASATWTSMAGAWHADNRMDFQLLEDMSGRQLLDRMATQSSIWLATGDDGKETPVFLNRRRARATSEAAIDADFGSDEIKSESLTIRQGERDDLFTRFRVRYNRDNFAGGYMDEIYVDENGGDCPTAAINTAVSAWCVAAQSKHGVYRELVFEADLIQDAGTAERLLKSLAARLSDRPWILSLASTLEAIQWQLGDFPVVEHQDWLRVGAKVSASGATLTVAEFGNATSVVVAVSEAEAALVEPGDWLHIEGTEIEAANRGGWYRITGRSFAGGNLTLALASPGSPAGEYSDCTVTVTPAMMVTATQIDGAEIELELTEIPRDQR